MLAVIGLMSQNSTPFSLTSSCLSSWFWEPRTEFDFCWLNVSFLFCLFNSNLASLHCCLIISFALSFGHVPLGPRLGWIQPPRSSELPSLFWTLCSNVKSCIYLGLLTSFLFPYKIHFQVHTILYYIIYTCHFLSDPRFRLFLRCTSSFFLLPLHKDAILIFPKCCFFTSHSFSHLLLLQKPLPTEM